MELFGLRKEIADLVDTARWYWEQHDEKHYADVHARINTRLDRLERYVDLYPSRQDA